MKDKIPNDILDKDKVFDKESALDIFSGDEELLKELCNIFINEYPKQIFKIKAAIEGHNSSELMKSAHRLKGSAANIGAKETYNTAHILEAIGKKNNLDDAEKIYEVLLDNLERLAHELSEYTKSNKA